MATLSLLLRVPSSADLGELVTILSTNQGVTITDPKGVLVDVDVLTVERVD